MVDSPKYIFYRVKFMLLELTKRSLNFKSLAKFLPYSPFVFAFIFVSRLLSPILLLRVGILRSDRIGHFASNTEVYLLNKLNNIDQPKVLTFDIWCFDETICNKALESIIRKKLIIGPKKLLQYVVLLNKKIDPLSIFNINHYPRDINSLRSQNPAILELSNYQNKKAQLELKKFGIKENDKFVAMIIRDHVYLDRLNKKLNWEYHNYRDCNLNNYLLAAEVLTKYGFHVFRMGKFVDKKFETANDKIIDYANSPYRSDLLDIYIGANCEFCISTGTGYDLIPAMFRRPIVYADHAPLGTYPSYIPFSIGIFKQYYCKQTKRKLTLSEIIAKKAHYFSRTDQFKKAKIELLDNTPEEIKDICLEMLQRLDKSWKKNDLDTQLQEKFWNKYLSSDNYSESNHNKIVSKIGSTFLRENLNLIN